MNIFIVVLPFRSTCVDAGPIGFPTEKREENLVQTDFSTCNPTRTSYT